ncbi:GNAT family N-acetyltransferase [Streptomyces sp. NPDC051569]|uniref:GNAT family N-acetyltransferase n=1 Tax=Streptomyces sp. NPDC051569 TaxID=3365661 RepID=UPI0037ADB150
MNHVLRTVRADEWAKAKEIRLAALRDPAAPVAFLETYEQAVQRTDAYWQERAAGTAPLRGVSATAQFIAEAPDGCWSGSVTMFVEEAGGTDFFGVRTEQTQGHLVGVYVRPERRGTGLIGELIATALDWAWSLEEPRLERVRLYVHEENPRAHAAYRRSGFVPTGRTAPFEQDSLVKELELAVARP